MSSWLSQTAIREVSTYAWNIICPGNAQRAYVTESFIRVGHEVRGFSGAVSPSSTMHYLTAYKSSHSRIQRTQSHGHLMLHPPFVPPFPTRSQAVMNQGFLLSFHSGGDQLEKRHPRKCWSLLTEERHFTPQKTCKRKERLQLLLGLCSLITAQDPCDTHPPAWIWLSRTRAFEVLWVILWLFSPLILLSSVRKASRHSHPSLSAWNPVAEQHRLVDFYSFLRVTKAEKSKIRFFVVPSKRVPSPFVGVSPLRLITSRSSVSNLITLVGFQTGITVGSVSFMVALYWFLTIVITSNHKLLNLNILCIWSTEV